MRRLSIARPLPFDRSSPATIPRSPSSKAALPQPSIRSAPSFARLARSRGSRRSQSGDCHPRTARQGEPGDGDVSPRHGPLVAAPDLARRDLNDATGASADARRALALYDGVPSRTGEDWFETACCRAALLGLAAPDGAGALVAEEAIEAATTMTMLQRAVSMGYRSPAVYLTEPALDSLRNRSEFRALMMDIAMPADPFAKGP